MRLVYGFVFLAVLGILISCKGTPNSATSEKAAPQVQPVVPSAPGPNEQTGAAPSQAAGIAWTVSAGWEVQPARQMRVATYRIHAVAGDPEDAECAVYFFGTGQGGTVQANLERWAHQFTSPDGQAHASAKMENRVVAGLKVSTLSAAGTYLGAGGMMGQEQVKKPNFRMQSAIVEAPEGLVFFKLIGPQNTVAAAEKDFNSLLESVHRQ